MNYEERNNANKIKAHIDKIFEDKLKRVNNKKLIVENKK